MGLAGFFRDPTHITVAIVWFGWFTIVFNRMIIPPLLPLVEARYHTTYAEAGLLMSGYMISYAISQAISGRIVERFGERKLMVVGILLSSFFTSLMSLVNNLFQLVVLRILTGLLAGLFFVPSTLFLTRRVPVREKGRKIGVAFTGGSTAIVLVYVLAGGLIDILPDWSLIFLVSASLGIPSALYILRCLPEETCEEGSDEEISSPHGTESRLIDALLSRDILLVLFFSTCVSLASWSLTTFLPSFLVADRQITFSKAANMMAVGSFAAVPTAFLGGTLKDRFGVKAPMLLSALSAASLVIVFQASPPLSIMMIVLAVWGLLSGVWWSPTTVQITEIAPTNLKSRILGISNFMVFMAGFVGPIIFGGIIDFFGFKAFFVLALVLYLVGALIATRLQIEYT